MIFRIRITRGFTLIEVLIAASIFAIIGVLATTIYVNMSRDRQRITSRNLLYDDAQFVLDQLTRQITSNTIDYEEYYNQLVIGGNPGMNFGHYASTFYTKLDPKDKPTEDCSDLTKGNNKKLCTNTGRNPATGNFPESANAFYASGQTPPAGVFCGDQLGGFQPFYTVSKYHACVKQLFLINGDANRKTMIAPELIEWGNATKERPSYVLSQATMVSTESDDEKTALGKIFTCPTTACTGKGVVKDFVNFTTPPQGSKDISYPSSKDLGAPPATLIADAYLKDYIPFTPSRIDIKDIKFYIAPVEDPHKAFAEANEGTGQKTNIHQPTVTIVLTVQPISNVKYDTKHPVLTVQTTVTPGQFSEIQSYPPQMKTQKAP